MAQPIARNVFAAELRHGQFQPKVVADKKRKAKTVRGNKHKGRGW